MSNFKCEICGSSVIDSPNGYTTGCEHYPIDTSKFKYRIKMKRKENKMDYETEQCVFEKNGSCSFYATYKAEVDLLYKMIDLMANDRAVFEEKYIVYNPVDYNEVIKSYKQKAQEVLSGGE